MQASLVHSITARSLVESGFLERISTDNEILDSYPLPPQCFEIEKLRLFGGFITRVKHNGLWASFPFTMIMLRHEDLELKIFAEYRATFERHMRNGRLKDHNERIKLFIDYLREYLQAKQVPRALFIRAVTLHEFLMWQVIVERRTRRGSDNTTPDSISNASQVTLTGLNDIPLRVPVFSGSYRAGRFESDPISIITAITEKASLPTDSTGEIYLAYFSAGKAETVRVLSLNPLTFALLARIDGTATVAEITSKVLNHISDESLVENCNEFFYQCALEGLIALRTIDKK